MIKLSVRLLLAAPIFYFVYGETGPWTTLALALTMIAIEVLAWTMGVVAQALKVLAK